MWRRPLPCFSFVCGGHEQYTVRDRGEHFKTFLFTVLERYCIVEERRDAGRVIAPTRHYLLNLESLVRDKYGRIELSRRFGLIRQRCFDRVFCFAGGVVHVR